MRWLRRSLVVLVVLAPLLLVADRVGAWLAGRVVADQVATELATYQVDSAPPEVEVDGFPFLTQVATGRYERVTVVLRDVGSGPAQLPLVELTATGVTASVRTLLDGSGTIRADRMVGTAVIGYASVAALAEFDGLRLAGGPDGRLRVDLPVEVAGTRVPLAGSAEVTATDESVRVRVTELTVADRSELPAGIEPAIERAAEALSVVVPLPPLPYGLAVESVSAQRSGLEVVLSASDVPLSS